LVSLVINQKRLQKALRNPSSALFDAMREEMRNHHLRFTKKVKVERMSGRPGLRAPTGTMRRGLIVETKGDKLANLRVTSIFTGPHGPIAKFHEEGTNAANIPPRLEFKKTWDAMIPDLGKAVDRAVSKALKGGSR
jgi:hypothetical protein